MTELKYAPATVSFQVGKLVEILAENAGTSAHDLAVVSLPPENTGDAGRGQGRRQPSRLGGRAKAKMRV